MNRPWIGQVFRNPITGSEWWFMDYDSATDLCVGLCVRAPLGGRVDLFVGLKAHLSIGALADWTPIAYPVFRWTGNARGQA